MKGRRGIPKLTCLSHFFNLFLFYENYEERELRLKEREMETEKKGRREREGEGEKNKNGDDRWKEGRKGE